jgi:hypothetical protein
MAKRQQHSWTDVTHCRAADCIHISRNVTSPTTDGRGCDNTTRRAKRGERLELIPKTNHHIALQITKAVQINPTIKRPLESV